MATCSRCIYQVIFLFICIPFIIARGANSLKLSCADNSDCFNLISNDTECVLGECICNNKISCEPKSTRNKVTVVGNKCEDDSDCIIDESLCTLKKCACHIDLVTSADKRKCLKVSAGLYQTCEEDIQCFSKVDNSVCNQNGLCNCQIGFHKNKFSCWKNSDLGGPCATNEECSLVKFAVCGVDTCTCDEKHVASTDNSRCLSVARDTTSPCREDRQCEQLFGYGAVCSGGVCGCGDQYSLVNGTTCTKNSRLKLSCKEHEDCRNLDGNLIMECAGERCECALPYYESEDFCISGATSWTPTLCFAIFIVLKMI